MSVVVQDESSPPGLAPRILVTGTDLLAGALASALERHGFATMRIAVDEEDIERGIEWKPDLVLVDARSFGVVGDTAALQQFRRMDLQVCVIDAPDEGRHKSEWLRIGASEIVDRDDPFDQLFRTLSRMLSVSPPARVERRSAASLASMRAGPHRLDTRLEPFSTLTDREQMVLAELMEGHCAEEIAKAAVVSISTVRSQIKSILQKLGVNSQLAAVALARRAGWSHNRRRQTDPKPASTRRSRAS